MDTDGSNKVDLWPLPIGAIGGVLATLRELPQTDQRAYVARYAQAADRLGRGAEALASIAHAIDRDDPRAEDYAKIARHVLDGELSRLAADSLEYWGITRRTDTAGGEGEGGHAE